jgi:predicted O-methyltransferase YrrM
MIQLVQNDLGESRSPQDPGEIGYGSGAPSRVSVDVEECRILAALAMGRTVIEIGTGLGVSTRAMAATALSIVTVDIDPWVIENVYPELSELGIVCLEAVPGGCRFDFAFIDGNHRPDSVKRDAHIATSVLVPGGFLAFHDVFASNVVEGIEKAGVGLLSRLDTGARPDLRGCGGGIGLVFPVVK